MCDGEYISLLFNVGFELNIEYDNKFFCDGVGFYCIEVWFM